MVLRRGCQSLWAAVLLAAALTAASPAPAHHLSKRFDESFVTLDCKGIYDASLFARVDRLCEDCYMLYRNADLLRKCRNDCFTTRYYLACIEALRQMELIPDLTKAIKQLHGADPGL